MQTPDKETQEILSDADHVKALLESKGWAVIKPKFDKRVLDMQNIANLDMSKTETITIQLQARIMAAAEMGEWWLKDVVGFVEQQEANNRQIQETSESYIEMKK